MTVPSLEELDSLKYSDLQNLAKSLGLRANLRADKLLKSLKAHFKREARKENENQDESQISSSFCDETDMQISSQEQVEMELASHVTKTRRRRRTVHGNPDSQQNYSEIKVSDPTDFKKQEKQENQDLRTATEVPSLPDSSQGDENAASSGKNGQQDTNIPSEKKKSNYTSGFSKPGKNKRTANTTPNFKKLHEARFKEMESIDQYIERKKKHFEEHSSLNELKKQPVTKGILVTPVSLRGRHSVACTPVSQRHSQGQPGTSVDRSALCVKSSVRCSALSATKMNVRFSATTKDNEHKRSLTKTPARKSPHVTISASTPNTPKGPAVLGTQKLRTTRGESAAVTTPFKLTVETMQTPVSHRKPVFDLKASLSRPLNYEPHKGKLKPWGQSKENSSLNEHVSRVSLHRKTYKQPPLQSREEQRKKHVQERKEKKAKILEARRGLIMAND